MRHSKRNLLISKRKLPIFLSANGRNTTIGYQTLSSWPIIFMEVLKSGGVSNSEFLKLRVKIDSKRKLKSNFLLHTENFKVKSGIFL